MRRLALVIIILGVALILMGTKALFPSGIALSGGRKLGPRASKIMGTIALLFGVGLTILGLLIPMWFAMR